MKHKDFEFNGPSRSNQRAKRRKTNLILNSLIVIVLLLIIIVSFSIFFSNGDEASDNVPNQKIETNVKDEESVNANDGEDEDNNSDVEEEAVETSSPVDSETDSEETVTDETDSEDETVTEPESEDVVTEGNSSDPNVKSTITNPDWLPVGTVQSGEHVPVYDESSTDWQEMLKAVSYGTGIDQNHMTVWFLGRNKQGAENQSVATVSTKDNSQTYRVFIEWVDNQGWKPIKIEELYER
jgi:hypothetical protein